MLKITENVLEELNKFIYFIFSVPFSLLNVISKLDIVESGQSIHNLKIRLFSLLISSLCNSRLS